MWSILIAKDNVSVPSWLNYILLPFYGSVNENPVQNLGVCSAAA